MFEAGASGVRRKAEVGQRIRGQPVGRRRHAVGELAQGRLGSGRQREQMERPVDLRSRERTDRRLLDHDVRIRSAEAKRAHAAKPRPGRPLGWLGYDADRQPVPGDHRVGLVEMQVGRNDTSIHRQDRLDQAAHPGRPFEMAAIRFDRTDQQRCGAAREHRAERSGLYRVADRGSRPVRLEKTDLRRLDAGVAQRGADHLLLRGTARHREPARPAVMVGGTAAQQGKYVVAIGVRVRQPFQHQDAASLAADVTVGACVERFAIPIGGKHLRLAQADEHVWREIQVDTGSERDVALAAAQAHDRR